MHLSRRARVAPADRHRPHAARSSTCRWSVIAAVRVQRAANAERGRSPGCHARVVRQGVPQPRRARRAAGRRSRPAIGATLIALMLGTLASLAVAAPPLLRPRDDLVPRRPPDRAAGHRHRHGAERDVPRGAHAVRRRARAVHGDRRPRHVLHRRDLQQRRSRGCGARRASFEEASADLGADTWQTFRLVTLPALRSAMVAGALLAFALSFDEVIVTTFTAGQHGDAADLDPHQPVAPEPAADRQRRRRAA